MKKIPHILIIGRQNVGKSTLFNRLIKIKKAIIDPTPGVTRDLVYGEINWDGHDLKIIDSGGITDEKDETNINVQKKTKEAQSESDLIIFLVEAKNPLPIEEEYIKAIRRSGKKAILVMNKSDSPEKDIYINEYYEYGFGEPIAISSAHNRNIDELMERVIEELKDDFFNEENIEIEEKEYDVKISILGKPNVGKSSLLNKIVEKNRSIVSSIPGTTRDVIDEEFQLDGKKYLLLDTAGIRKKSKVKENIEYYSVNRAIKSISLADVIFLVIDSLENISDQDKKITDQIVKNGKGLIVVLNKWDLQEEKKDTFNIVMEQLLFKFPILKYVPIIKTSAKTGEGIKKLLNLAFVIKNELLKKISTSELNDFINEIIKKYAPSTKGKLLKIYYGTQISTSPVHFMFFINNKHLLSNNYKQYLINKLREYFGYTGVPIKVIFKDKKSKISKDKFM